MVSNFTLMIKEFWKFLLFISSQGLSHVGFVHSICSERPSDQLDNDDDDADADDDDDDDDGDDDDDDDGDDYDAADGGGDDKILIMSTSGWLL